MYGMLGIFRDDEMDFKKSKTVDELMTETEDFVINPEGETCLWMRSFPSRC